MRYAVELTVLCQDFNCLPRAGGLKDQDARDVWLMRLVMIAQAERRERDRARREAADAAKRS